LKIQIFARNQFNGRVKNFVDGKKNVRGSFLKLKKGLKKSQEGAREPDSTLWRNRVCIPELRWFLVDKKKSGGLADRGPEKQVVILQVK